jgi:YbbR domain-containing protein
MIENNLQLTEDYEFTASAPVRGQRRDVYRLGIDDFDAVLNLSGIEEEGEYTLSIIVTSRSRIEFEFQPSVQNVRVKVERIESKIFEVIPIANIRLAEGMQIDESGLTANPPTVKISGEKSIIDSIVRAEVHAVHTDEMFSTQSVEGELRLFNSHDVWVSNPDIIYDNEIFTVTVPIHKVRSLPLDFIITGAPSNFDLVGLRSKMVISPDELMLSSPDTSIDHLSGFDIGEIPLSEITLQMLNTTTRDTFAPKLPEGYKNISGNASFTLRFIGVEEYAQYNFPVPRENITILNPPTDFNVEILTRELTVTVVGPASYVQAMSRDDIYLTLNLINMPEITTDSRMDSRTVQWRIRGSRVPAWIVGNPQVDVSFTRIEQ